MKTINIYNQMENSLITLANPYVSPHIEVIEISVEKGFADSTQDLGEGTW